MKIPYTICFIMKEDKTLMLYRNKKPNQHKWNGVGGKIESGENIFSSIKREIMEETGLLALELDFSGIVTWNEESGMYVFICRKFEGEVLEGPEGKLEWKSTDWVITNNKVVSNIKYFLPQMLKQDQPIKEHAFYYNGCGEIVDYQINEMIPSIFDEVTTTTKKR
ncbi:MULTISPECIES: NUDIX hydrolase [Bacillus]|uniref:NUDIX hydrolase n=1 Tax=Bacillus TaxID=1386 RepID=UPI000BB6DEBE|nr:MULTISPECIES: 8-oxo-dGTP diphosphatase [Bacillus]